MSRAYIEMILSPTTYPYQVSFALLALKIPKLPPRAICPKRILRRNVKPQSPRRRCHGKSRYGAAVCPRSWSSRMIPAKAFLPSRSSPSIQYLTASVRGAIGVCEKVTQEHFLTYTAVFFRCDPEQYETIRLETIEFVASLGQSSMHERLSSQRRQSRDQMAFRAHEKNVDLDHEFHETQGALRLTKW